MNRSIFLELLWAWLRNLASNSVNVFFLSTSCLVQWALVSKKETWKMSILLCIIYIVLHVIHCICTSHVCQLENKTIIPIFPYCANYVDAQTEGSEIFALRLRHCVVDPKTITCGGLDFKPISFASSHSSLCQSNRLKKSFSLLTPLISVC